MSTGPSPSSDGSPTGAGLWPLTAYFLKLGTIGFGGPPALVGFMHRDLVEQRGWISEDEYKLALALAQIMPGPLAAQTAIAIGYFQAGIAGATLVGLAFILPSFLMVIGISMLYVAYGGLWWMQALFYGIGAAVIAIIAIAAYRLARSTNGGNPLLWGIFAFLLELTVRARHPEPEIVARYGLARNANKGNPLLWGIFAVLFTVTVWAQAELAEFFLLAGLVALVAQAPPRWLKERVSFLSLAPWQFVLPVMPALPTALDPTTDVLIQILLFFTKAGAFVFGSGLAIVPFLYQGTVVQFGWLNEQQFLDAVAVAMITPGPVVITVAFIGYLVAGLAGATVAAIGIFLPVYVFTIIPAPWFKRHRDNAQLRAFVSGATAAATGAIAGAVVVLGQRAIFDLPTAVIAAASLGLLWRFRLSEPVLVAMAGVTGLVLWPLVRTAG